MIATTGYSAAGPARRLAFFEVCANSARDVVDQVSNAAVKTPIHPKFFILQPQLINKWAQPSNSVFVKTVSRRENAEPIRVSVTFRVWLRLLTGPLQTRLTSSFSWKFTRPI